MKPNFLVFVTDEMQSFSLGCNGNHDVKTPNIDKIAEEGTNFQRAYCNNSVCMPSRASMITGLTPRQHGCLTNGTILPENMPTLPQILGDNGYRTHSVGKLHLQPFGSLREDGKKIFSWEDRDLWDRGQIKQLPENYYGFQTTDFIGAHGAGCFGDYKNWLQENHPGVYDKYKKENSYKSIKSKSVNGWGMEVPQELHYNNWIADSCIEFLDDLEQEQNFFLWCSFPDPHLPFASCKPYSEMYDPDSLTLKANWNEMTGELRHLQERRKTNKKYDFDEDDLRAITAQTYGMISHIDDNVGRIMNYLEQNKLSQNTVVVFMSDHGEYLGSHHLVTKDVWPWEELLRVPFIWKTPENITEDNICDETVSLLDFVPTIIDYADIDEEEFDIRGYRHADKLGLPGRSLRETLENGEKLISKPAIVEYDEDWAVGPVYRTRTLVADKYKITIYANNGGGILVDLEDDPEELNNLWDDPDYSHIKCELITRLLKQLTVTDRLVDQPRICGA